MTSWSEWLRQVDPALRRREQIEIPRDLPPPPSVGFTRNTGWVEPHGQQEDWVCPLSTGSRLHAHKYPDGRWVLHLDNYDPNVSLLYAALHLGSETVVGKIVLFGGLAYAGHRWWIG
jgi:hypothetical protein